MPQDEPDACVVEGKGDVGHRSGNYPLKNGPFVLVTSDQERFERKRRLSERLQRKGAQTTGRAIHRYPERHGRKERGDDRVVGPRDGHRPALRLHEKGLEVDFTKAAGEFDVREPRIASHLGTHLPREHLGPLHLDKEDRRRTRAALHQRGTEVRLRQLRHHVPTDAHCASRLAGDHDSRGITAKGPDVAMGKLECKLLVLHPVVARGAFLGKQRLEPQEP
mmetsp:Transcript_10679/g.27459  ORF Transcript_10679/g.27459 Transcript_10679/m.27459 type:complete len:221 (-) Transcript_10679:549-1211(-)